MKKFVIGLFAIWMVAPILCSGYEHGDIVKITRKKYAELSRPSSPLPRGELQVIGSSEEVYSLNGVEELTEKHFESAPEVRTYAVRILDRIRFSKLLRSATSSSGVDSSLEESVLSTAVISSLREDMRGRFYCVRESGSDEVLCVHPSWLEESNKLETTKRLRLSNQHILSWIEAVEKERSTSAEAGENEDA